MVYLDLLLVGFGHVGQRFARLLQEKSVALRRDYGLSWRVVGIATRHHGSAYDARGLDLVKALKLREAGTALDALTGAESGRMLAPGASGLELIRHATGESKARHLEHLVLVETTLLDIERGQPAIDHVTAALRGGAHVVTANKGPVAFACRELQSIAELAHRAFLFESAVMDGIPVFNLVRETLPVAEITGFRGVVNATTNYILTAMESGRTFDEALREMQQAGIAESDPSFDVDGWDAAAKAAALMNVLLHGAATPRTIDRSGIRDVTREAAQAAVSRGKRLRLVARASGRGAAAAGRVAVEELDAADPLANLGGMQNLLVLQTDVLGDVGMLQLDGGLIQTAYGLLSDLVTIAKRVGDPAP